jgi:hypothetical protein
MGRDESIRWLRPRSEVLRRRHLLGWSLVLCLGALVCAGTAYVSHVQSFEKPRRDSASPAAHEALPSGSSRGAAGRPDRVPESTLSLGNSPETLVTDQVPAEPFSAGEADLAHTARGNTETPAAGALQIIPELNETAPPPAIGIQAKQPPPRQNVRTATPDRRIPRETGSGAPSSTGSAATPPELPSVLQLQDQR